MENTKTTEPSTLKNRIGRFRVTAHLLREQPEDMKPLFAEMIVLEAQMKWGDFIEYLALSERFDINPDNLEAPFYEIFFERIDGVVTFKEVQRKK